MNKLPTPNKGRSKTTWDTWADRPPTPKEHFGDSDVARLGRQVRKAIHELECHGLAFMAKAPGYQSARTRGLKRILQTFENEMSDRMSPIIIQTKADKKRVVIHALGEIRASKSMAGIGVVRHQCDRRGYEALPWALRITDHATGRLVQRITGWSLHCIVARLKGLVLSVERTFAAALGEGLEGDIEVIIDSNDGSSARWAMVLNTAVPILIVTTCMSARPELDERLNRFLPARDAAEHVNLYPTTRR